MLENIFLISFELKDGNLHPNLSSTSASIQKKKTYIAYPDDVILNSSHNFMQLIKLNQERVLLQHYEKKYFNDDFLYSNIKAINIQDLNILLVPLPYRHVLGIVFDKETNPYDYRNEIVRLLLDYALEKYFSKPNSNYKETLLLTLFVDLRNYANESHLFNNNLNKINYFRNKPYIKLFVFGIDYAGKSSLMRLLSTGKFDENFFIPTKKFRITNVSLENGINLTCWDMPGQIIYREDWLRGAQASNLLVFVIDVADRNRYAEAKAAFWKMINLFDLQYLPLIFLINKIDLLEKPINKEQIEQYFELSKCTGREITTICTSLPTQEGIDKLKDEISRIASHLLMVNGIIGPSSMVR
ncbi:MAG: 50S ribosome-binding GTPase [Candidatus Lokiarchaeota archaeon]|nr:50S ribosome-binding GTPase [Candidatus Harpocratesius repetitus]